MRYGIPGKKGRRRKRLGHFEANEDRITLTYRKEWLKETDGKIIICIPDPPEFNDFRFRRELHHIAFNYLAWKLGIDEVLKQKYDAVRKYIRYASYNEKWHYAQVGFPDNEVRTNLSISLVEDAPELVVRFVSYIDDFYMDVFQTDSFKAWVKDTLPNALIHTIHNV